MNTNNRATEMGKAIALTNNPDLVEAAMKEMAVEKVNVQMETQVSNSTTKPEYEQFDSELMALSNNPDLVESYLRNDNSARL